ncbi:MAG: hypothetical protein IKR81_07600, partial [Victivallales bacterium]|nr:hypothetical protein [Victivallales bacterium]
MEYALQLPVPSTVKVEEANGILNIDATFKPTRAFDAQLNREVDEQYAEDICTEALRRYFEVGEGSITYSGLQSVGEPAYSKDAARYIFTVPKGAVKVVAAPPTPQAAAPSQKPPVSVATTPSKPGATGA